MGCAVLLPISGRVPNRNLRDIEKNQTEIYAKKDWDPRWEGDRALDEFLLYYGSSQCVWRYPFGLVLGCRNLRSEQAFLGAMKRFNNGNNIVVFTFG